MAPVQKPAEAIVVLKVRIRKPGNSSKVSSADVTVRAKHVEMPDDCDTAALKISKELVSSPEYKEICAHDTAIRAYLRSQALPSRLTSGQYLVPLALVEKIDARVLAFAEQRDTLVDAFILAYPSQVEAARDRLGDLFEASDYADAEELRAAFDLKTSISAIESPAAGLQALSAGIYKRECAKHERAMNALVTEIRDGMRLAFAGFVSTLVENLTADGGSRRIMGTHLEKLGSFIDEFAARNAAIGDTDLEALVAKARDIVAHVSPTKLRASLSVRAQVGASMEDVRRALDGLTTSNGSTLRASFLETEEHAGPKAPVEPSPEAKERAKRLELNEANAVPAPEIPPTKGRGAFLELGEPVAMFPSEPTTSTRGMRLELDKS